MRALGFAVLSAIVAAFPVLGMLGCGPPGARETADERMQNPWFREGREAVLQARQRSGIEDGERARNVILFVGDGMGLPTVTAARILEGQQRGESGEANLLSFERLPHVALSKTYTADYQVSDSAGTMTAMISGVKTRAGVLGVDERVVRGDHTSVSAGSVPSLLEEAETRGLSTGLVTTARVTHATPGACYAHTPERWWENDTELSKEARASDFPDVARQLIEFDHGDGIDVVLGGGREHFLPSHVADPEHPQLRGARGDGRDLSTEWRSRFAHGVYVWNRAQFEAVRPGQTTHLLGLFEPKHMRYEVDRASDPGGEPSLSEMTAKAIDILARNPRGFVLVVEGARIDHAHHLNNAYRALTDTIEFSNAVRTAQDRTDPEETLIVVTADHAHVMTISGYPKRGNDILGLVYDQKGLARDLLGLPYATLSYANGPGYAGASDSQPAGPKRMPHAPIEVEGISEGRPDLSEVDTSDPLYVQEATMPRLLETHGGQDVPIYAGGPGAALFNGVQEQNFIYHALVQALGWLD